MSDPFTDSRGAWQIGTDNPQIVGGLHRDVKQQSQQGVWESNHIPPNASYYNTPYATIPEDERPAVSMRFYNHRNARGMLGGASSTGGSGVHSAWAAGLQKYMAAGQFYVAMAIDVMDVMNTTAPNRTYYKDGLIAAAQAAYAKKLMDENGLAIVLGVIDGSYAIPPEFIPSSS